MHEESGQPVEMGAIRIELEAFDAALRQAISRTRSPSAGSCGTETSTAGACRGRFWKITPNPEMTGVFWMRQPHLLYGRRTEMVREGRKVGDIVEVLPPVIR